MTSFPQNADSSRSDSPPAAPLPGTPEDFTESPHLLSYLSSIADTLHASHWMVATLKPAGKQSEHQRFHSLRASRSLNMSELQKSMIEDQGDRKAVDQSRLHPTPYYATFYRGGKSLESFTAVLRVSPSCLLGVQFTLPPSIQDSDSGSLHHAEAALQALARFAGRPYDFHQKN